MSAYRAFVSHAAGDPVADALVHGMQTLVRPRRGQPALGMFRESAVDDAAPPSAAAQAALDGAEWFVLLASPASAASDRVGAEIRRWVAGKGADRLLVVVTAGTWRWDSAAADVDLAASSAAHPALGGVFGSEPRHMDLSWARGEDDLTVRNARFGEAVAEIVAPMHGLTKDEIVGEDVRAQRRTVRRIRQTATALAALTVLALAGTGVATAAAAVAQTQRERAVAERERAEEQARLSDSRRLAALSGQLQSEDGALSRLLAIHAWDLAPTAEAETALRAAAQVTDGWTASAGDVDVEARLIGHEDRPATAAFSPDGRLVATTDQWGTLRIWQVGTLASPVVVPDVFARSLAFSADGRTIGAAATASVRFYDVETGTVTTTATRAGAIAPYGPSGFVGGGEDGVMLLDATGTEGLRAATGSPVESVGASADGEVVVASTAVGDVIRFDSDLTELSRWRYTRTATWGVDVRPWALAVSPDGSSVVLPPDGREVLGPSTADGPHDSRDGAIAGVYDAVDGSVVAPVTAPHAYMPLPARSAVYVDADTVVAVSSGGLEYGPSLGTSDDTDLSAVPLPPLADIVRASPDGTLLLVAGNDVTATVVRLDTAADDAADADRAVVDAACRLAGRNLSEAEWETYIPDRPYAAGCEGFDAPHVPSAALASPYPSSGWQPPAQAGDSATPGPSPEPTAPDGSDGPSGEFVLNDIDLANSTFDVGCLLEGPAPLVDGVATGSGDFGTTLRLEEVVRLPMDGDDVDDTVVTLWCTDLRALNVSVVVVDGTSTGTIRTIGDPIQILNGEVVSIEPGRVTTDEPRGDGRLTWTLQGGAWVAG